MNSGSILLKVFPACWLLLCSWSSSVVRRRVRRSIHRAYLVIRNSCRDTSARARSFATIRMLFAVCCEEFLCLIPLLMGTQPLQVQFVADPLDHKLNLLDLGVVESLGAHWKAAVGSSNSLRNPFILFAGTLRFIFHSDGIVGCSLRYRSTQLYRIARLLEFWLRIIHTSSGWVTISYLSENDIVSVACIGIACGVHRTAVFIICLLALVSFSQRILVEGHVTVKQFNIEGKIESVAVGICNCLVFRPSVVFIPSPDPDSSNILIGWSVDASVLGVFPLMGSLPEVLETVENIAVIDRHDLFPEVIIAVCTTIQPRFWTTVLLWSVELSVMVNANRTVLGKIMWFVFKLGNWSNKVWFWSVSNYDRLVHAFGTEQVSKAPWLRFLPYWHKAIIVKILLNLGS